MKRITKTVFVFSAMAVMMLGMAKVSSAEVIDVNSKNFPDTAVRSSLKEYATEGTSSDTDFQIDTDKVTYLTVDKAKDLTGIELLTKLGTLDIQRYKGTKIELNNSKLTWVRIFNTKSTKLQIQIPDLKGLSMWENSDKASLKSIDISKAINLESVGIYSTKMKTVDVSENTKLTRLFLFGDNFTSVDVSKNKNLNSLSVSSKKLKPVDVSKNKKLKELSLDGSKKIKSVDVSKNTKLTALSVTNMKVKDVDISKNKKLTGFACYGTKISSLNLKKHTRLGSLDVSNTKLNDLNLKKNKKIKNLRFINTGVSSLSLKNFKNLQSIGYYGSKIKKLDLTKYGRSNSRFWIEYDVKKGTTINLKPYLGTGYKCSEYFSYDWDGTKTYDSARNTIKVTGKKGNCVELKLKKGNKKYYIRITIV